MDLKIIQSLLEKVQIHKNAEKTNNLWDLNSGVARILFLGVPGQTWAGAN